MPSNMFRSFFSIILVLSLLLVCELEAGAVSTWQQTNGPYGGDILTLAIDPTNDQTLYAISSGAGILKSDNGGENWYPVNMV